MGLFDFLKKGKLSNDGFAYLCVYTDFTGLPWIANTSMVLSTDKAFDKIIKTKQNDIKLNTKVITNENKTRFFEECYVSGYDDVIVDKKQHNIKEFIDIKKVGSEAELKCRQICFNMIITRQLLELMIKDQNPITKAQRNQLYGQMSQKILLQLLFTELFSHDSKEGELVVGKTADDQCLYKYLLRSPKNAAIPLNVITVPNVAGNWIAVYTDKWALSKVQKQDCAIVFGGLMDLNTYDLLDDGSDIEGIIVNPLRENFFIPKLILKETLKKYDGDKNLAAYDLIQNMANNE